MELGLAATVVRDLSALPTMYALMSANEYMTHRYFQHLEFNRPETFPELKALIATVTGDPVAPKVAGDGHVEHHAETYDDMSLKNDERWRANAVSKALDDDIYRGTAFHWHATAIMTLQMAPSVFPTYMLMGWSPLETLAILLPSMLLHAIVWNAIHPPMHGLPPVSLSMGFGTVLPGGEAFSEWLLESAYGRYIYENHMGHHVLGGQCNYNVCCPMADHLLGTYVPTAEWQPKMRPLPANAVIRGPVVAPQTHGGVPQLPTREVRACQHCSLPLLPLISRCRSPFGRDRQTSPDSRVRSTRWRNSCKNSCASRTTRPRSPSRTAGPSSPTRTARRRRPPDQVG